MHNIFEIWLGTDKYSFDDAPYNYKHCINIHLDDRNYWITLTEEKVKEGEVLWFFATFNEFNPQTGEHTFTTWHKAGTPREKIILNQEGKQDRKKINVKKMLGEFIAPPVQPLDNWLDEHDEQEMVVMVDNPVPVPMPPGLVQELAAEQAEQQAEW
jgi:hypothetical protein